MKIINPRHPDQDYNLPSKKWVVEEFVPFFFSYMENVQLRMYKAKFDCDDFASWFKLLARAAHSHSSGTAESLALFEIWYEAQGTGGVHGHHAINAFYAKRWYFIEPQNGRLYDLTEKEINSIFHVIC
jgi:hypothetical protein